MSSKKIPVGVLGATGMVGQNYLRLLQDHPWFEVVHAAASPQSAGKTYAEAVEGRWLMREAIPDAVAELPVNTVDDVRAAKENCRLVFSAFNLDKKQVREIEEQYAAHLPVVSNHSAHRRTEDVPVIIPEVNPGHTAVLPAQRRNRGWEGGFLVTKPNCSVQSFLPPVHALLAAGYPVDSLVVTTLQAVSGAGYPGTPSLNMIDNVVPYIPGEEEKSEQEPLKILGQIQDGKIVPDGAVKLSVQCSRVPVRSGHMAAVSLTFRDEKPEEDEIIEIWNHYQGEPQLQGLPSAPHPPIVVREEVDRPQPVKDRAAGGGMAVSVGRLRPCPVMDIRFVTLSHNTIRGAAGGAILTAELLKAQGYLDRG